jgi:hypothetical protein
MEWALGGLRCFSQDQTSLFGTEGGLLRCATFI